MYVHFKYMYRKFYVLFIGKFIIHVGWENTKFKTLCLLESFWELYKAEILRCRALFVKFQHEPEVPEGL